MNCDRIAPFYQTLERLAFGNRLQAHRTFFLRAGHDAQTALVLGDGDGRFLAALVKARPHLAIDYVDISAVMLTLAEQRLSPAQRAQINFVRADAVTFTFPRASYDLIYSHFFLDCFTQDQVVFLVRKIACVCHVRTCWVISEFRQAEQGWQRMFCQLWLTTMYFFFRLATQLQTRHLPAYETALRELQFHLQEEHKSFAGLITSQCWMRLEPRSDLARR